jgi:HEAT repeat protein
MGRFSVGFQQTLAELQELIQEDDPELQDALAEALRHPNRRVRTFAALHLADLFQDVRAVRVLADALEHGTVSEQRAASSALWEIGDSDSAGMINALMNAPLEESAQVVNALYWIGWSPDDPRYAVEYYVMTQQWRECIALGGEAVPGLSDALSHWDGAIRRGAAWALGEIGAASAVFALAELLNDIEGGLFGEGDRVCDIAAEALAKIGTPEAWDALDQWNSNQGD